MGGLLGPTSQSVLPWARNFLDPHLTLHGVPGHPFLGQAQLLINIPGVDFRALSSPVPLMCWDQHLPPNTCHITLPMTGRSLLHPAVPSTWLSTWQMADMQPWRGRESKSLMTVNQAYGAPSIFYVFLRRALMHYRCHLSISHIILSTHHMWQELTLLPLVQKGKLRLSEVK